MYGTHGRIHGGTCVYDFNEMIFFSVLVLLFDCYVPSFLGAVGCRLTGCSLLTTLCCHHFHVLWWPGTLVIPSAMCLRC
jgi:hypothetical protein